MPSPLSMGALAERITNETAGGGLCRDGEMSLAAEASRAPPARPVVAASLGNESRPGRFDVFSSSEGQVIASEAAAR